MSKLDNKLDIIETRQEMADYYCELLKNHCASMMYTDTLGQYKAKQKYDTFEQEWKIKLDKERQRAEQGK